LHKATSKHIFLLMKTETEAPLLQWLLLKLDNLAQARGHLAQASQSRLSEALTVAKIRNLGELSLRLSWFA